METRKLIGLRLKELRLSRSLSQEILAEKSGISSKYLSSIERGKENPTLDTFIRLSAALGVEISEMFDYSHKGSLKDLRDEITGMIKGIDEERLRLAARVIKAIYL